MINYEVAFNNLLTSIGALSLLIAFTAGARLIKAAKDKDTNQTAKPKLMLSIAVAYLLVTMLSQIIGSALNKLFNLLGL